MKKSIAQNHSLLGSGIAVSLVAAVLYNGPGASLLLLPVIYGVVAVITFLWLLRAIRQQKISFISSKATLFFSVWVLWLLSSSLWSHFPQLSWYYALTIGAFPIFALIWVHQEDPQRTWNWLYSYLLIIGVAAALWGIAQYLVSANRVTGPLLDFNAYGAVLYLFIFSLVPRIFQAESGRALSTPRRLAQLAAFFILALALFATYSRGAIGTSLILAIAFLVFARNRYPRYLRTTILLLVIALVAYGLVKIYPQHMIDRSLDFAKNHSVLARLMMWHSMWEIYQRHPWLGTGIGTFKLFYPAFRNPADFGSAGDMGHNDYIQFLQEQGPLGLLFLCIAGLLSLWLCWKLFIRRRDPADLATGDTVGQGFGLTLGVIGLFIHATVNFIFYVQPLSLLAGLFLGQAYRSAGPARFRTFHLPEISPVIAGAGLACVLGLPLAGLFVDGVATTVIQNQGNLPYIRTLAHDPQFIYRFASALEPLRPGNIVLRGVLANHELAAALDSSNPPFIRAAAARQAEQNYIFLMRAKGGRNASALSDFARLTQDFPGLRADHPFGWPFTPDNLLRHAIRYDPMYFPAYRLLARRYAHAGHPEKALHLITHKAFRWFGVAVIGAQPQRIKLMEEAVNLSMQLGQHARARALAENLLQNDGHDKVAESTLKALGVDRLKAGNPGSRSAS